MRTDGGPVGDERGDHRERPLEGATCGLAYYRCLGGLLIAPRPRPRPRRRTHSMCSTYQHARALSAPSAAPGSSAYHPFIHRLRFRSLRSPWSPSPFLIPPSHHSLASDSRIQPAYMRYWPPSFYLLLYYFIFSVHASLRPASNAHSFPSFHFISSSLCA